MKERRRYRRRPGYWPVYLWLNDSCFLPGRTKEVAGHSMRIEVLNSKLSGLVKPGQTVRVQVHLPVVDGEFTRIVEVRRVTADEIGAIVKAELPLKAMGEAAPREPARSQGVATRPGELSSPTARRHVTRLDPLLARRSVEVASTTAPRARD